MPPIVVLNAVGLTPRLLPHAPRLAAIAEAGWQAAMPETLPAVTCTAQATLLTGTTPERHGIVANGWHFRDTNEVRFWQQSNALMQAEPIYATAKARAAAKGETFTCAKLFWWFNQGAAVDWSVTPKPWYALDGDKRFDIATTPIELADDLKQRHGDFPFASFWGPNAGLPSTAWIAEVSATVVREKKPSLSLVYLPHLDYEPQRRGPAGCDMPKYVRELDDACAPLLDAATAIGAQVWVVSEYGHCDVARPIEVNRYLRKNGFLRVRSGPFGEQIDLYGSAAFAVCDHQLAHVTVRDPADIPVVRDLFEGLPGVAKIYSGVERAKIHLDHPRSGDLVLLAERDAWFAYPFWLDDAVAPDYARAVAIHHKPGYDPCELFFDPKLAAPKLRVARKVLQKKLGFRTTVDVVPLDPSLVRGSHGLAASDPIDRPILIGHGENPGDAVPMTAVKKLWLRTLGLGA
jgi:predicted AlkP superfamily pyrophosphatase or phosphodiesterase